MKIKFIIEQGNIGTDATCVNVNGVIINNPIAVTRDFNIKEPLGFATVTLKDGKLYAEMEITEKKLLHLYPAIGFTSIEKEGIKITRLDLKMIGLSGLPNADESILSINEQLKQNETTGDN